MEIKAFAKINLSLDIIGKRNDGYHDISSIMQSVSLCDEIDIKINENGNIIVRCDNPVIPVNGENIAYKAAKQMKDACDITCGFDIDIKKRIPVAGGMAGGSTDGAAVIRGINELCNLGLSKEKMMEIGVRIGADVPFCIQKEAALCEGIGEVITPVKGLSKDLFLLIVNPETKVSTKLIYEKIDENVNYNTVDNEKLVIALEKGDIYDAKKYMKNVMQAVSASECNEIAGIVEELNRLGAVHSMMSGSGATCFGIFEKKPDLENAKKIFCDYFVTLAKPI